MSNSFISKSSFLKGIQCEKQIYLYKNHYDLRNEEGEESKFATGISVGELARTLLPNGIEIKRTPSLKSSLIATQYQLGKNPILYEAAFLFNACYTAVDILEKTRNGYNVYEVKSSTSVNDTHLLDTAFQYYVLKNADINIRNINVVTINKDYVRKGNLDVKRLFSIEPVTKEVLLLQPSILKNIKKFQKIVQLKKIPDVDIGEQCNSPYPCMFTDYCWKNVPKVSVFDLTRLTEKKKFDLYFSGAEKLEDISDEYRLSYAQQLQVECHINKSTVIEKEKVREFVNALQYPLYYMDFETFMPAIPQFNSSGPYQQIVFQYSLHYKKDKKSPLKHFEFLGEEGKDPRKDFIERLLSDTKSTGDILVYNKSFEITRLKELAELFPIYRKQINERISRVKDLMYLFQKKHYYSYKMNGSYSIKKVLPALIPSLSYDELEIGDGGDALSAYESLTYEPDSKKRLAIRKNLLKYCKLDTFAMVKLLEKLEKI